MKILLTGVAGFLGSNILEHLLKNGHHVVGVDDLSSGNVKNIAKYREYTNFKFLNHDVRLPINIDTDAILNFACPASPKQYQFDPVRTIETNFLGALNLLKLSRNCGATLIQASTSEIYGDPLISPQMENYWGNVNPIGVRSCYDEGKRAAETLCFDFFRQYAVDTRIVRIFNTYGPNMSDDDGRVVSNFISQALKNDPITIYGTGKQTRSFCYVDDLVEAVIRILNLKINPESPVNLGNPEEFSILELAKKVIELTNSNSEIIFKELPMDDPKQRKPDISKAKSLLNWNPKVSLEEGLFKTINFFRL